VTTCLQSCNDKLRVSLKHNFTNTSFHTKFKGLSCSEDFNFEWLKCMGELLGKGSNYQSLMISNNYSYAALIFILKDSSVEIYLEHVGIQRLPCHSWSRQHWWLRWKGYKEFIQFFFGSRSSWS